MKKENKRKIIMYSLITALLLCAVILGADWLPLRFCKDKNRDIWMRTILGQTCGTVAVVILLQYMGIRLFSWPQKLLWAIPCLIVAVNNFPFISYYNGNMSFARTSATDVVLFAVYCFAIGFFEETVFRGVLFVLIAERLTKDRKGLVKTFVISACAFGFAHIFNIFGGNVGGTLLQIGYTTLTGGLFAFVLIKTKNLICCAVVHGVYNFCGLLLSAQGLGNGVVFDAGTVVMTAIIAVCAAIFVFYGLFTYKTEELRTLYARLGIK